MTAALTDQDIRMLRTHAQKIRLNIDLINLPRYPSVVGTYFTVTA
jgi:hypothetical protein